MRSYRTGPMLEAYVEATDVAGDAVSYWLQLTWTPTEWIIGTAVTINRATEEHQDVLREFDERQADTLQAAVTLLREAVCDLVAAAEDVHPRGIAAGG